METTTPVDLWIEEKDARERAEQRVSDFKEIALNWCTRAGDEHRDALRNRRAFVLATLALLSTFLFH